MAGGRGGAVLLLLALCLQPPPARARSLRFVTLVRGTGGRGGSRAGPGRARPGWGDAVPPAGVPAWRPLAHQGLSAGPAPGERLAPRIRAAHTGASAARRGGAGGGGRAGVRTAGDPRCHCRWGCGSSGSWGRPCGGATEASSTTRTGGRRSVPATPARRAALSAAPRWARAAARARAAGGSFGKGSSRARTRLQIFSFLSLFPLQEEEGPKHRLCAESGRGARIGPVSALLSQRVRRQIQPEL